MAFMALVEFASQSQLLVMVLAEAFMALVELASVALVEFGTTTGRMQACTTC